jgi:hypothetical protein
VVAAAKGLPIPSPELPPIQSALVFVSDAAGARFANFKGSRISVITGDDRGVASIGIRDGGSVWFLASITWPKFFLYSARDSKGSYFGCKSATLEATGLLLPFLTIPHLLASKEVRLLVDNISIMYSWDSRYMKDDITASIMLRALHLISCRINCLVHVEHLLRLSSPAAVLADHLSRQSTTGPSERAATRHALRGRFPALLKDWLREPTESWDFALACLRHVESLI